MALATSFKRRARQSACALAVLCVTAHATSEPADRCIVADRAIGCIDERSTTELMTPRKNNDSVRALVRQKLQSGQCRLFNYGERVSFVSAKGSEHTAVRRPGDRNTWWLPASWTQPATQCDADASSATLFAKLGLHSPHNAPASSAMSRLPYSPSDEDSLHVEYANRDEHSDTAETVESRAPHDQAAPQQQSRDDPPPRNAIRIEFEREDSRFRTANRPEPYAPDEAFGRDAPPPQHAPLRSSIYARSRRPPRNPPQGSCTSGVIVTDDDIDPCEELSR